MKAPLLSVFIGHLPSYVFLLSALTRYKGETPCLGADFEALRVAADGLEVRAGFVAFESKAWKVGSLVVTVCALAKKVDSCMREVNPYMLTVNAESLIVVAESLVADAEY